MTVPIWWSLSVLGMICDNGEVWAGLLAMLFLVNTAL